MSMEIKIEGGDPQKEREKKAVESDAREARLQEAYWKLFNTEDGILVLNDLTEKYDPLPPSLDLARSQIGSADGIGYALNIAATDSQRRPIRHINQKISAYAAKQL